MINDYVDSLNCVNYVSDIFDANTGIWWHCHDDYITQIGDSPKGVNIIESHKKILKKMSCQAQHIYHFLFTSEQSI